MSRLGHGKGYYDFFVNEYSARKQRPCLGTHICLFITGKDTQVKLLLVALALNEQVIGRGKIPMADHDRKMDFIVTPEEVISEGA